MLINQQRKITCRNYVRYDILGMKFYDNKLRIRSDLKIKLNLGNCMDQVILEDWILQIYKINF